MLCFFIYMIENIYTIMLYFLKKYFKIFFNILILKLKFKNNIFLNENILKYNY